MKKSSIIAIITVIIVAVVFSTIYKEQNQKQVYLQGSSQSFDAYVAMIGGGKTMVVIGARYELSETPEVIQAELILQNGQSYPIDLKFLGIGSYNTSILTTNVMLKNSDNLKLAIYYNNKMEEVNLFITDL